LDSLYSRFPAGSVGVALLLLRLVDGSALLGEGIRLFMFTGNSSEPTTLVLVGLALVISAVLLMLGLRTSMAGSAAAIFTAGATLYATRHSALLGNTIDAWLLLFVFVFFLSGSLALLGAGAYSLDARLSGWRTLNLSARQPSSKDGE
jgi:uncharacterized membrane protein YphA (DoxX/SURF4 family)